MPNLDRHLAEVLAATGTDVSSIRVTVTHGRLACEKVPHVGSGHLHADDDDRPYSVDGVRYCGRCHTFWPHD